MEDKNNEFKPTNEAGTTKSYSEENVILKIESFITVMKRLISLIEKENKAIRECDFKEVRDVQEAKLKYTNAYAEGFKSVAIHKSVLNNLSQDKKKDLESSSKRLNKLMSDNALLLRSSITANKKIVDTIVKAADTRAREEKGFYSSNGKMGDNSKRRHSLSVNTIL